MNPPSGGAPQEHLRALLEEDFQLAFLAHLIVDGLKPLSRWEKPTGEQVRRALEGLGLSCVAIRRPLLSGREIVETVFSLHPGLLALYSGRFLGCRVDRSPETLRVEGLLFGFPGCCVEAFLRSPYRPNGLPAEDQRILFHWACPDCGPTRLLLPAYRRIHGELMELASAPRPTAGGAR